MKNKRQLASFMAERLPMCFGSGDIFELLVDFEKEIESKN